MLLPVCRQLHPYALSIRHALIECGCGGTAADEPGKDRRRQTAARHQGTGAPPIAPQQKKRHSSRRAHRQQLPHRQDRKMVLAQPVAQGHGKNGQQAGDGGFGHNGCAQEKKNVLVSLAVGFLGDL